MKTKILVFWIGLLIILSSCGTKKNSVAPEFEVCTSNFIDSLVLPYLPFKKSRLEIRLEARQLRLETKVNAKKEVKTTQSADKTNRKNTAEANKTERVRLEQEGKTDRKEAVQDGKTARTESVQGGKTDRKDIATDGSIKKKEIKDAGKTDRSLSRALTIIGVSFLIILIIYIIIRFFKKAKQFLPF